VRRLGNGGGEVRTGSGRNQWPSCNMNCWAFTGTTGALHATIDAVPAQAPVNQIETRVGELAGIKRVCAKVGV
jgi:hypothetical protein